VTHEPGAGGAGGPLDPTEETGAFWRCACLGERQRPRAEEVSMGMFDTVVIYPPDEDEESP